MRADAGAAPFAVRWSATTRRHLIAAVIAEQHDVAKAMQLEAARGRLERGLERDEGTVMVPGKRMCATGGSTPPSGTYATTGATSVLPSSVAMRSARNRRVLCC
jgi:hypothetical protein